jgi:phage-related protein
MPKKADITIQDCIFFRGTGSSIGWAVRANGKKEAEIYWNRLEKREQVGFLRAFEEMVSVGRIFNQQRFRKLEGRIFEFKYVTGARILCSSYDRVWWLTHGYTKQSQKTPPNEIRRANQIMKEHIERFWGSKKGA